MAHRNEAYRRDVVCHQLFRPPLVELVAVQRARILEVRGWKRGMCPAPGSQLVDVNDRQQSLLQDDGSPQTE